MNTVNIPLATLIYGGILHLCSIVGLVVLIALGKGPVTAEWALLTALVTAAIALPVTISPSGATPAPVAPVVPVGESPPAPPAG